MDTGLPSLIFITGTDGAGKSCHAKWLAGYLNERGIRTGLGWSRFNNYISKPFLALTRLTGHNHYETFDGILFGFHDFERLYGFRILFALMQAIDVNIAAFFELRKNKKCFDIMIYERGPWDTLADVIADTGITDLFSDKLGRLFSAQIKKDAEILLISRSREKILTTRPELIHDYKLELKTRIYEKLAKINGWHIIDNNSSIEATRRQILNVLGIYANSYYDNLKSPD